MLYLAGCRHFHQARNMLERALSFYPQNSSTLNEVNIFKPFDSYVCIKHILLIIALDLQINDLLKVAKTNFVVLKLLADGHKKDSKEPPVFDFSYHQHFPLIKLI